LPLVGLWVGGVESVTTRNALYFINFLRGIFGFCMSLLLGKVVGRVQPANALSQANNALETAKPMLKLPHNYSGVF